LKWVIRCGRNDFIHVSTALTKEESGPAERLLDHRAIHHFLKGFPVVEEIDPKRLPAHIAVIMDGNGRWAKKKLLNRISGHMKGVDAVRDVVTACREIGIQVLTLYAFSEENWRRPKEEVTALMGLLKEYLLRERKEMLRNEIRLRVIGRIEDLPARVQKTLRETMSQTSFCKGMILNLALSYSGRSEILHAVQDLVADYEKGKIKREEITTECFSRYLWTWDLPDPDLLIRTSGERRISNFLLWQLAYTELYLTDTLWPDFGREELIKAIADYQSRERRFGMTSEQVNGIER
jgi:undecaprenyl diphosphate synthase